MNDINSRTLKTFSNGYTLVGNGDLRREDIELCTQFCPHLIAVDGGANMAHRFGYTPAILIGDLDSCTPQNRGLFSESAVLHIGDQNSTDFDKALRWVEAQHRQSVTKPGPVLSVGFMGARIDHTLATMNTLARFYASHIIVIGEKDVVFLAPSSCSLALDVGTRLSLFPLAPVQGKSCGLKWAIDGISFTPNGRIGTSNETITSEVALDFNKPAMLIMVPRKALTSRFIKTICTAPRLYDAQSL